MGVAERKEREREQRRRQIQEAAKRVFLLRGFMGATMEEIAKEAELSIGTIYFYFACKEDLYASLNLATIAQYEEAVERLTKRPGKSADEKLTLAWEGLHEIFWADPVGLRGLLHTQVEGSFDLLSPDLMSSLNESGKNALDGLASIVREGIDDGTFSEGSEIITADILWALFTGLVIWEGAKKRTDPNKDYLKSTLDHALEVIKHGIMKKTNR